MTSTLSAIEERVLIALATVRDPELDEPITALGFVASCTVADDGRAVVRLRLPTYFCAPNFAFLMVADAFDAVSATEGVSGVDVALLDHFAGEQINAGVAARAGFVNSFAGEAVAELDQLRTDFLRKAVMAGTDVVCRPLTAGGMAPSALAALTMGEVPESAAWRGCVAAGPNWVSPRGGRAAGDRPGHRRRGRGGRVAAAPQARPADQGRHRRERRTLRGMLSHRYPEAKENEA